MSMELRQLRYFVAVAEELHFARAAARVGIEQSPLSRGIRDLEARIGVKLFHRTTRTTTLTYPGEVFLQDARRVLAMVERMRRTARDAAAGRVGRIRMAVCAEQSVQRVAELLRRVRTEFPDIEIEISDGSEAELIVAVRTAAIDLCIAGASVEDDELISVELWRDPLVCWLRKDSTHASHATVLFSSLERELIRGMRVAAASTLVAAGVAYALMPACLEVPALLDIVSRPLAGAALTAPVFAVVRSDDSTSALRRVLDIAQESRTTSKARVLP
jgi:DNA-binding transcriptional LysR family regulator